MSAFPRRAWVFDVCYLVGQVWKGSLIERQRLVFALLQQQGVSERRQIRGVMRTPNQRLLKKLCSSLRGVACAGKQTQDVRRLRVLRLEC